jgi:3-oxoacyl-[acyl-carrier-protein] synthase-3
MEGKGMAIEIRATGRAVPKKRVTNDELAKKVDTSDEWIRSHAGIGARHLVEEDQAASDLALEAAKMALSAAAGKTGIDEEAVKAEAATLDFILVSTVTPDHYCCPSTACLVQRGLGAVKAAALDINAGCTGFVYGLETAAALLSISDSRKRMLVICAETLSRVTNWEDRSTCVLFGDGAGAVLLEKTEDSGRRGILRSVLGADGSGSEALIVRRGGGRAPFKKGETVELPMVIEMDGRAVYNFAVKAVTGAIEHLMEREGLAMDDIKYIIPHQANARIVHAAGKRLHIPTEKLYLNIEEYANTSSASIPIALDELNKAGKLNKGDIILTVGFGAGLTYGGNVIIW